MATTFHIDQLRERDKILEEKHKKELDAADRKLEKFKNILLNSDKEYFDLRNRGIRLAQALGFSDIGEVQRAIDVSDYEATFHQAFERVQILEDEVRVERREKELLQSRCRDLEEQLAGQQEHISSLEKNQQRLRNELLDIKAQFEGIKDAKERAAVFYRRDRRRWYKIYSWLCLEPIDGNGKIGQDISVERLRQSEYSEKKREMLREFGPGLSRLLGIDIPSLEEAMRITDEPSSSNNAQVATLSAPSEGQERLLTTTTAPQTSTPPLNRQPLVLSDTNIVKQEQIDTPKLLKHSKQSLPENSSDTEDDSQAPSQNFKVPLLPMLNLRCPTGSSDTEDDSQAPNPQTSSPGSPPRTSPFSAMKPQAKRFMTSNLPSRPPLDPTRRKSDIGTSAPLFQVKPEPEDDLVAVPDERPAKRLRTSLDSITRTPQPMKHSAPPGRRVFSTGQVAKDKKQCEDENTPIAKGATRVRISGQTRLEDYTTFKGRGRYAKEKDIDKTKKTINSLYLINTERNGGASHQYDEVVRDNRGRMRMDAGDCEDCRDWYAAIGPMPARDQGPLWRSPSKTPVRPCKQHGAGTTSSSHDHDRDFSPSPADRNHAQADVEAHRKQISRHRHNWARPKTPPGYWNIGFPDTQETRDINERAEEMHQQKLRDVEREAERGRWIRR